MWEIQNTLAKSALACAFALAGMATFNIAHAATFTTLYAFAGGNDGAAPEASVIDKNGNLYGTTTSGCGNGTCNSGQGCGTIFRLASDGTESALYSFCSKTNCADGAVPAGGLLADEAGNFYGVTYSGGAGSSCTVAAGCGTVFKLAPNGAETVLYSFCSKTNCSDGSGPTGGLIMDKKGNLYGATFSGGTGTSCSQRCGTVFRLTTSGSEKALYSFCPRVSCQDGEYPTGSLIRKNGVLYGTTSLGGHGAAGTVFAIAADGTESVLYSFCSQAGCTDGISPTAGLVRDKSGNFYGTTSQGGSNGCGTVYKLAPDGTESVLHSCRGGGDGVLPNGGLVMDNTGNLYGTTNWGGSGNCEPGCGTIFEVAPNGTETVLYSFTGGNDGAYPYDGVRLKNGNLYGTASAGGANKQGTIFELPLAAVH